MGFFSAFGFLEFVSSYSTLSGILKSEVWMREGGRKETEVTAIHPFLLLHSSTLSWAAASASAGARSGTD